MIYESRKLANQTTIQLISFSPDYLKSLQLQGECKIKQVRSLKIYDLWKLIIILCLYSILTCVIGLLVLRYSVRFKAWLMYEESVFEDATHVLIMGNDEIYVIQEVFLESNERKMFFYRRMKYQRNSDALRYHPLAYNVINQNHLFNQKFTQNGLNSEFVTDSQKLYGKCEHNVQIPTFLEYMINQLLKVFFILQYIICITYILEKNYQFAAVMLGVSIFTTSINYFLLRSSFMKIKEIAEKHVNIQVLRQGVKKTISSIELVPGDLFFPEQVIPCDCILVKGEVFVNQASLTGQNIPIGKFPPENEQKLEQDSCWLFQGAKLLEFRGQPLALVVYTGFSTRKGRIFRKILNNVPVTPQFFHSGVKFLTFMFVAAYIIYFAMIKQMIQRMLNPTMIILRAFDVVGWAIPAAFPIYFNLCYSFSLMRLRNCNIFGTQPQKTVVSGKIKTMCFDKTGTLTQNTMELYSIQKFISSEQSQEIIAGNVTQKNDEDIIYKLFASCHTVRKIRDQFMGDELDLRMFLFSQFSFELGNDVNIKFTTKRNNSHINVLRINQFQSKFQCMSVLVKDVTLNKYYIFVKGAPEKIQRASLNKYNKFQELISSLSLRGLRNIAFGYKQITNIDQYITARRQDFQKDLTILGVVGFQNKLKYDTVETIKILMEAEIQPKIITGDNIYIAVETAMRTGILPYESKIILLEGRKQKLLNQRSYNGIILTHNKVQTTSSPIQLTFDEYMKQQLPIAIDNDFLKLQPEPYLPSTIKLFSRISPESKALIVKRLKQQHLAISVDQKVGMCGDGANDLMAIKEADVGMGISDTDSSFAANFSIQQLKGVQHIMRQGKATLMNVIETFRYYGCINFIKITSSMILIFDSSYFTGNQITFFNYASTIWLALLLALSGPSDILTKYVPNDNFLSLQNWLVYVGHTVIPTAGLIIAYYYLTQTYQFIPNLAIVTDAWVFTCQSNTTIFLCIQLMFIFNIIWIYQGEPYKKPFFKNILLTILLLIDIGICMALFFLTNNNILNMTQLSNATVGTLLAITFGTIVAGFVFSLILYGTRIHLRTI